MDPQNFEMLENFGISQNIFSLDKESIRTDVFVIKQEKIKKNFSEGAITKIPLSIFQDSNFKSKDDMGLYDECDQEYSVFGNYSNEKNKIENEINFNFETKFQSKENSNFHSLFCNFNDFNFNNNFISKKSNNITTNFSNLSSYQNFSSNFNSISKNENSCMQTSEKEGTTGQIFSKNENCDNNQNYFFNKNNTGLKTKKISNTKIKTIKNENDNLEIKLNEKNLTKNNINNINNYQNINEPKSQEAIISNDPLLNFNENLNLKNSNFSNQIETEKIDQNCNKSEELFKKEELKNGILENSMQNQMEQLNRIFLEMNQSSEAKVIIKAYKSKLKTKFYKIYESNSKFYKEKNKYKIFHKCNFPGCSRTFASAGWLKSHFNEHLQELKSNKFNLEFEKSLMKLKQLNLLK